MTEFIKVTYTGKEKETDRIFDTNDKKVAEANEMYDPKFNYKPVLMILGKNQLIKGFEEGLKTMKVGEQKTIEISPEKGYGERKKELIQLVPMQVFKNNKIEPYPGMIVQLEGMSARVQAVSGGRVRVDFNHELAGKVLIFDVKLESKIEKQEDQLKALVEQVYPMGAEETKINGKEAEITMGKEATAMKDYQPRKNVLVQQIKVMLDMEDVKIIEKH